MTLFNAFTGSVNTFTGSLRAEVNGIEAYTASLKSAAIVSSSTQIQNYFLFAQTSSANTFYGNQTITGSLNVSSSITASLREGYVWVGGPNNITTLVATSSFGTVGGGTTDISQLNFTSGALNIVTASVNFATGSINTFTGSVFRFYQTTASIHFTTQSLNLLTASLGIFSASLNFTSGALNTFTGSIRAEINNIEAYTASLKAAGIVSSSQQITNYGVFARTDQSNVFTADQGITGSLNISNTLTISSTYVNAGSIIATGSSVLQITSGSWVEVTGSINITGSFTSSLLEGYVWAGGAGNISKLVATSSFGTGGGGGTTDISQLNFTTGALNIQTASINVASASLNLQTGSQDLVNRVISIVTGSINFTTSSLNTFTGSIRGEINGIEAYTSSLKAVGIVSSSQQIQNYNLFATTGSNQFNGDQIITGSLTAGVVYTHQVSPRTNEDLYVNIPTGQILDMWTDDNGGEIVLNAQGTYIQTNATQNTWLFDKAGILTVPGNIVGAANLATTGSNTFYGNQTVQNGYVILSQVSQSLNFSDDAAAAIGGVPLGGLYRNGNFIAIRIS